jgi:hypothetical protein
MTAAAVGIVSAVISIVSTLTATGAQMQAEKEKKAIGREQQRAAEAQAAAARKVSERKQDIMREQARRFMAKQAASIGASGVEFTGSPLLAMKYSREQIKKDLELARLQGQTETGSWEQQADIIAKNTAMAYKYGMWGTALQGLGGVGQSLGGAASYYQPSYRTTTPTTSFTYKPGAA